MTHRNKLRLKKIICSMYQFYLHTGNLCKCTHYSSFNIIFKCRVNVHDVSLEVLRIGHISHINQDELINKGSTEISNAEQGLFNSNLVTTSGCITPIFPIALPLSMTVAQRPWK